jgi:hypothetical protein
MPLNTPIRGMRLSASAAPVWALHRGRVGSGNGNALLCANRPHANKHTDATPTACVQGWVCKLQRNNRLIVHAAANAQEAVNSIL